MVSLFLFLILVIFPLGQLTRLPLALPQLNLYWHDILLITMVIVWFIKIIFKKEKYILPNLARYVISFIGILAFSWVIAFPFHSFKERLISFGYLGRFCLFSFLYFIVCDLIRKFPHLQQKIYHLLIFAGVAASVLGLLQYVFMPDLRPLALWGWDPHYFRVVGTYLDPTFTGMIYVLTLIVLVLEIWKKKKNFFYKLLFMVVYLSLALTYSRASFLAYLVGMTIIGLAKKSKKFIFLVFVCGLITVLLLPRPGGEGVKLERQSTIIARLNNWRQSLIIFWPKPLFGIGFNNYRYSQRDYGFIERENWEQTHSGGGADASLLFILGTSGVAGLITFGYLLSQILTRKPVNTHLLVISSTAALVSHSFFSNSLFYSWLLIWWWLLVALDESNFKENNSLL